MTEQRPYWKGYLKLSLVTCPVAMTPGTSGSEKVRFHTLNLETGNRVVAQYIDSVTGKLVKQKDEARGYERGEDDYIILTDEDLDAVEARHGAHHRHRDLRAAREHRMDLSRTRPTT